VRKREKKELGILDWVYNNGNIYWLNLCALLLHALPHFSPNFLLFFSHFLLVIAVAAALSLSLSHILSLSLWERSLPFFVSLLFSPALNMICSNWILHFEVLEFEEVLLLWVVSFFWKKIYYYYFLFLGWWGRGGRGVGYLSCVTTSLIWNLEFGF
jgi:hypothetical protein